MSRGFGSTFGSAATGELITANNGYTLSTGYSASVWAYINGAGQSNNGLIYGAGAGTTALALRLNGGTGTMLLTAPWSTTRGDYSFTPAATSNWQHIGITYSGSSTANVPTVYVNGVSVSVSTTFVAVGTFGGTYTTTPIGNATAVQWDGMLAHPAIWKDTVLTAGDVRSLASGINPLLIRPERLVLYMPLDGINSPEFDFASKPATVTLTRLGVSDPPVQPLSRIRALFHNYDTNKSFQSAWAIPVNFPQQGYGT